MVKKVLVTQREYFFEERNERVDGVDQSWTDFLEQIAIEPLLVPNRIRSVESLFNENIVGLILTGGGDIDKDQTNRDRIERQLFQLARNKKVPVIGICRGCQLLALEYGWKTISKPGHVGKRHRLNIVNSEKWPKCLAPILLNGAEVNSFHNYALDSFDCPTNLVPLLQADDQSVEMFSSTDEKILGLMWHPEREKPFRIIEQDIFRNHFGDNK